jgi:hypothetical protein
VFTVKCGGCESLRAAVISGLTAFRNDVIGLEEERVLMGSNEEFRSDIDQGLGSDS